MVSLEGRFVLVAAFSLPETRPRTADSSYGLPLDPAQRLSAVQRAAAETAFASPLHTS